MQEALVVSYGDFFPIKKPVVQATGFGSEGQAERQNGMSSSRSSKLLAAGLGVAADGR
jgi:hypothetical protein